MNVIQEQIDDLNAVLTVTLDQEDYQEKVKKSLKDYSKKVSLPGFRAGMVPMSLIQKMHGKAVLVDEVNKLLQEKVDGYIKENKLELIGNALPSVQDKNKRVDWDNDKTFEFKFDIAFAPKFTLDFNGEEFNIKKVMVDDATIETYANNIAKRYGKLEYPEYADEDCLVYADFVELAEDGSIVAGGIFKNSPVSLERLTNQNGKDAFVGKKLDETFEINPADLSTNASDLAAMLGIETSQVDSISKKFQAKITAISKMVAAEYNEQLFEKVYGSQVTTVEEFKNKIREELSQMFEADSNRMLKNDIQKRLIEKTNLTLPTEFLKRWIMAVNEKPLTLEQLEVDFDRYVAGLKWQLIENKLIVENAINVTPQEAKDHLKEILGKQFAGFNNFEMEDEKMEATLSNILQNPEQAQNIYQQLYDNKLMEFYKSKFNLKEVNVPEKDFYQTN
jgi:trigger factor